MFSDMNEELV